MKYRQIKHRGSGKCRFSTQMNEQNGKRKFNDELIRIFIRNAFISFPHRYNCMDFCALFLSPNVLFPSSFFVLKCWARIPDRYVCVHIQITSVIIIICLIIKIFVLIFLLNCNYFKIHRVFAIVFARFTN